MLDQQRAMLRESLREFVRRSVQPYVLEWERNGAVPRELFAQLGELGFLGFEFSEEFGGSGLDFSCTALLVEELVRCGSVGVAVSVMAHAEFATKLIDRHGTRQQKERFLRPAIQGQRIGALGVTEPDAGSDVAAVRTTAVRDGDDYLVNGVKTFITNGTIADFVTTAVRTGGPGAGGISLLIVPTDAPGFRRGQRLKKLGCHASDTAELAFENCRVPAVNLLGPQNDGFKLIREGFAGERLVLALVCCSQMRLMWEEARRYGHQRQAFGRPLLGFQVWRHRLSDALTTICAAEALTRRAMDLYVQGAPCDAEISMAKLFAAEAVMGVAHDCAQIFGGYCYMEEYPIARLYRDSLAFSVGAGTSEIMREIISSNSGLVPQ
jgi:citronellyl-CoA dehydrogenase